LSDGVRASLSSPKLFNEHGNKVFSEHSSNDGGIYLDVKQDDVVEEQAGSSTVAATLVSFLSLLISV